MGVGVSSWQLASAVAGAGQLGVVSGTASAVTQARRLALGDPGGHVGRALDAFPIAAMADRVRQRYLDRAREGEGTARFRGIPRPSLEPGGALTELTVVANFIEVFLARSGHDGLVGVNYLEKIQLPTLASLYGAMLAGVDYVLMGAGIPARIPALLDQLAVHAPVTMPVTVVGADRGDGHEIGFDPGTVTGGETLTPLKRPRFLAIVSSATMATFLARNAAGSPDGFVVETPTAGGHNAPPRGKLTVDEAGEPVYGPRDAIDLASIADLGLPFWLAGGYATPAALAAAREAGAAGIQVGTAFAFCDESGLTPELKQRTIAAAMAGSATIRTDPQASPTGYPFKVLQLADTLSDPAAYEQRPRLCDLGYLRDPYKRPDGKVGYRCPAEPVEDYVSKGGEASDTVGRRCLCNALVADIGLGQVRRDGYVEGPMITAGDDVAHLARFIPPGRTTYAAADVLEHLLGLVGPEPAATADPHAGP
jgi:NAD(P)H-dependent flavin oxidoreductase YrpB (nitropropane dioxygenase family)